MSPAAAKRQKRHPNLLRGHVAAKSSAKTAKSKPRGRPFAKGKSGNPRGRAPGVPNKVTREVKALAQSILEDPLVQQRMLEDAQKGRLAPPVMTMLFHYAYGKPKDTIHVEGGLEPLTIRIVDEYADERPGGSDDHAPAGS